MTVQLSGKVWPVLKTISPQGVRLYLGTETAGPFRTLGSIYRDDSGHLLLMRAQDNSYRHLLLDGHGRIYGPYREVRDIRTAGNRWIAVVQDLQGMVLILRDGKQEPVQAVRAWSLELSPDGSRYTCLWQDAAGRVYRQSPQGGVYLYQIQSPDLLQTEDPAGEMDIVARNQDWTKVLIEISRPGSGLFLSDGQHEYGPYRTIGETVFSGGSQWLSVVQSGGRFYLLTNGQAVLLKGAAVPGSLRHCTTCSSLNYALIVRQGFSVFIHTPSRLWGPYKAVYSLDPQYPFAYMVEKNGEVFLWTEAGEAGPFTELGKVWPIQDRILAFSARRPDSRGMDILINGGWVELEARSVQELIFVSLQRYAVIFKGKDERFYVQHADGRRWGPYAVQPRVLINNVLYTLDVSSKKLWIDGREWDQPVLSIYQNKNTPWILYQAGRNIYLESAAD